MRRNTIISDVFSRLHYMDRRGSGLSRIIESYDDFEEKPKFLSDESSFTVIFPNKGYSPVLSGNNPVLTGLKENLVSDEDYFLIKLYKSLGDKIGAKTLSGTRQLFMRFHYDELFTRENIKEIFNVQNSRASEIISILLKSNLIENAGDSKYKFKK